MDDFFRLASSKQSTFVAAELAGEKPSHDSETDEAASELLDSSL